MFHIELRQFPHVARAFNLTREELDRRILLPWVAGRPVEWDDRRWSPDRARLTVYEGRELRTDEIGLGRGWANVTRDGRDVTATVVSEVRGATGPDAAVGRFKRELLSRCQAGAMAAPDAVRLAGELHPDWRVSDRLALAERAMWELLHEGEVRMIREGAPVGEQEWEGLLLSWKTWSDPERAVLISP
jgi:hypothetical protein